MVQYFENALLFLSPDSWKNDTKFTYDLHFQAAIAANQCNRQSRFNELTQVLDAHVIHTLDKLKLAELKIQNANVDNDQNKVIELLRKYYDNVRPLLKAYNSSTTIKSND